MIQSIALGYYDRSQKTFMYSPIKEDFIEFNVAKHTEKEAVDLVLTAYEMKAAKKALDKLELKYVHFAMNDKGFLYPINLGQEDTLEFQFDEIHHGICYTDGGVIFGFSFKTHEFIPLTNKTDLREVATASSKMAPVFGGLYHDPKYAQHRLRPFLVHNNKLFRAQ